MRVLIVDDNRDSSFLVSELVRFVGHEAMALTAPQAAVDIARDWKPEVVLLDLAMPGISGYDLARQLRENADLNGAKIIALSGYQRDEEREKCAGIDAHILKPMTAKQLATLLGKYTEPGASPQLPLSSSPVQLI
jgi:CheY-like chemotaxis protein